MQYTARKALLKSAQFYLKNWQDVLLLATKVAFLIIVAEFLTAGLIDAIFGTDLISLVKRERSWGISFIFFAPQSPALELPQQSLYAIITSDIITLIPYSWFLSPLISSLSRSIISGEKFDGTFLPRLTEARCLKIALVLGIMRFALVPFEEFFRNPELMPPLLGIAAVVLVFPVIYILYRLYYLLPTFALDRQFSTIAQTWLATKDKAWSTFKVHFLTLFLFGISMFLLVFLIQNLGFILNHTGRIITFEILSTVVFALIVEPVFVGGVAATYMILEQKQK